MQTEAREQQTRSPERGTGSDVLVLLPLLMSCGSGETERRPGRGAS